MKNRIRINIIFLTILLSSPIVYAQFQIGSTLLGDDELDNFGQSVALSFDGTRMAVGASMVDETVGGRGYVRTYDLVNGTWVQVGQEIQGQEGFERSGIAVSLSDDGNTLAIGAHRHDSSRGTVRIFTYDGSSWVQAGSDIDGEGTINRFGQSVALAGVGSSIIIGAPRNNDAGTEAGHARIFDWNGSEWTQIGSDIDGEAANDLFGTWVAYSNAADIAAVGAPLNGNPASIGHVRVFRYVAGDWSQMGDDIDGPFESGRFGQTMSLSGDGNRIAIGGQRIESDGAVLIYDWNGSAWEQVGNTIFGQAFSGSFGFSVSLSDDGNKLAVGAPGTASSDGDFQAGKVFLYQLEGGQWVEILSSIDGENEEDHFGFSLAMSPDGQRLVIGTPDNDNSGSNGGQAKVYELSSVSSIFEEVKETIGISPNPASGLIRLHYPHDFSPTEVKIFDRLGRQVFEKKTNSFGSGIDNWLDLNDLPNGLYVIWSSDQNQIMSGRFTLTN